MGSQRHLRHRILPVREASQHSEGNAGYVVELVLDRNFQYRGPFRWFLVKVGLGNSVTDYKEKQCYLVSGTPDRGDHTYRQ
jgi:hypothetical protein